MTAVKRTDTVTFSTAVTGGSWGCLLVACCAVNDLAALSRVNREHRTRVWRLTSESIGVQPVAGQVLPSLRTVLIQHRLMCVYLKALTGQQHERTLKAADTEVRGDFGAMGPAEELPVPRNAPLPVIFEAWWSIKVTGLLVSGSTADFLRLKTIKPLGLAPTRRTELAESMIRTGNTPGLKAILEDGPIHNVTLMRSMLDSIIANQENCVPGLQTLLASGVMGMIRTAPPIIQNPSERQQQACALLRNYTPPTP